LERPLNGGKTGEKGEGRDVSSGAIKPGLEAARLGKPKGALIVKLALTSRGGTFGPLIPPERNTKRSSFGGRRAACAILNGRGPGRGKAGFGAGDKTRRDANIAFRRLPRGGGRDGGEKKPCCWKGEGGGEKKRVEGLDF